MKCSVVVPDIETALIFSEVLHELREMKAQPMLAPNGEPINDSDYVCLRDDLEESFADNANPKMLIGIAALAILQKLEANPGLNR